VKQISDEFTAYKKDANDLQAQKDRTARNINVKSDGVKENLKNEIGKVDEEMKKHFSHHKAENSRLQQQISQLQGEKNNIQNQITALQRRISDIEMQVGNDN
jgi:chromosome segregation ATPase